MYACIPEPGRGFLAGCGRRRIGYLPFQDPPPQRFVCCLMVATLGQAPLIGLPSQGKEKAEAARDPGPASY
jgi:hypothetical protein